MPREPRPVRCPACGAETVARIAWGLIVEPLPGKVVYGGCCVPPDPPKWACQTCEHQWGLDEIEVSRPDSRKRNLPPPIPPVSGKDR